MSTESTESTESTDMLDRTIHRLEDAMASGDRERIHHEYDQAVGVLAAHLAPEGGR